MPIAVLLLLPLLNRFIEIVLIELGKNIVPVYTFSFFVEVIIFLSELKVVRPFTLPLLVIMLLLLLKMMLLL